MSDFDENIDPLDPRFVDAVLARARRRADAPVVPPAGAETPVEAPPAAPSPPPVAVAPLSPVVAKPVAEPEAEPWTPPSFAEPDVPPAQSPPFASTFPEPAAAVDGGEPTEPAELDDDDDDDVRRRSRNIVEWVAVAVGAVVVAFLIRAFLLQAFYIPSESMEPTLRKNDRILVNKLSYKLHDINRGDLVVFEKPPNEHATDINDLIKRVIARPNETIELHADGTITIDGGLLTEPYLRDGQPPGVMTMTRDSFVEGACTNPVSERSKCVVGEGFVFVMGDNRDHSHDSRWFGPIDEDLVVGRAFVKVWPLSGLGLL